MLTPRTSNNRAVVVSVSYLRSPHLAALPLYVLDLVLLTLARLGLLAARHPSLLVALLTVLGAAVYRASNIFGLIYKYFSHHLYPLSTPSRSRLVWAAPCSARAPYPPMSTCMLLLLPAVVAAAAVAEVAVGGPEPFTGAATAAAAATQSTQSGTAGSLCCCCFCCCCCCCW